MTRFRVTVRDTDIELRGYVDGEAVLRTLADDMAPTMVIASPAEDDYDPFAISEPEFPPTLEASIGIMTWYFETFRTDSATLIENLANLHFAQANVIRGERGRAERAEAELAARELHHFEVEQENARLEADNARLRSNLEQEKAEHESTLHIGQDYLSTLDAVRAARSNHPECKKHPDDDVVTCGWKVAIQDIDKALTGAPE